MAEQTSETVGVPCPAYNRMRSRWDLIDRLLGGTPAMRDWGETGLPREEKESLKAYERRLARSFLYEAFSDTVENLASKPFSEAISIAGELPEPLDSMEANLDRAGRNLQQVARASFANTVAYGKGHFLIDMPAGLRGNESLEESRQLGVRPAIIEVSARDLIGWRSEKAVDGSQRLTQVRIRETRDIDDGRFGSREATFIRVFDAPKADGSPGTWSLYQQSESRNDVFDLKESGVHAFQGVPLVTWYTREDSFMVARPPLEGLANLNLAHWQSFSDYRNISRFASVAQRFATGLAEHEIERLEEKGMAWNELLLAENPEAKFGWTEHTGKAIESLESGLRRLEERMEVLGLSPLIERTTDSTATGVRASQGRTMTRIRHWIRLQEWALEEAYKVAAAITRTQVPEDFRVRIFSDFEAVGGDPKEADLLLKMRAGSNITQETLLREMKRRAVLSEDLDVEEELEELEQEAPPMPTGGLFGDPFGGADGKPGAGKPGAGKPGAGKPGDIGAG